MWWRRCLQSATHRLAVPRCSDADKITALRERIALLEEDLRQAATGGKASDVAILALEKLLDRKTAELNDLLPPQGMMSQGGGGGSSVPPGGADNTALIDMVAHLPQRLADFVGDRACRTVEVPASKCKSTVWDEIEPQLRGIVYLDLFCVPPCCQPRRQPVQLPVHQWPQGKREDHPLSIKAGLAFLHSVLPADIIVVPVQDLQWLNASFYLANIKLVITMSKTDYILVHKPAWDALAREQGIELVDGKVSQTVPLRDHLPRLLPYILGFYESKTPTALASEFKRARAQAILELLAAWHMLAHRDAPVVLLGDFSNTYCIHASGGPTGSMPSIHVAGPALSSVPEQQPASLSDAASDVWALALTLLENAKQRLQTTGPLALAIGHQDLQQPAAAASSLQQPAAASSSQQQPTAIGAVASGSHQVQRTRSQQDGAWAATAMDRAEEHDSDMEEAARVNVQAQQLMSIMQHPEIYSALGLDAPPTTLQLGDAEDVCAGMQVLSVAGPPSPEARGSLSRGMAGGPGSSERAA